MVATLGATVSRADDCDPRSAAQGGQYQLQNQQVWVPGTQQQVWVPGACNQWACDPGGYQVVTTGGHYENRQEWVWVAAPYQPRQQYGVSFEFARSGRRNEYGRSGRGEYGRNGRHHGAAPVGYR